MEISDVKTILLSCPVPKEHQLDWDWRVLGRRELKVDMAVVEVSTDEGITGVGEPSNYAGPEAVKAIIEYEFKPELIGKDPFDVEKLTRPGPYPRGLAHSSAMAGINQALWDIIGKSLGKPVYKLFGGAYAERIRVYASAGQMGCSPEDIAKEAAVFKEEGFTAYKLRVNLQDYLEKVRVAREVLGDDADIMVEWNMGIPNAKTAVKVINRMERFDVTWTESPLPGYDVEGYAEVRKHVDVPVSGGEEVSTFQDFKKRIDQGAYDIVQPDSNLMGINEARKVATLADLKGLLCCPHNWHSAINRAANAHLVASIPNHFLLEWNMTWNHSCPAFKEEIVEEPITPKDGYIEVPKRPGLGVELNEEAIKKYPFIRGPVWAPA